MTPYIGYEFEYCSKKYRITDVGTRTIIVIELKPELELQTYSAKTQTTTSSTCINPEEEGWYDGPPYAVPEIVFDIQELPQFTM